VIDLDGLTANARRLVEEGYYRRAGQGPKSPSLVKALRGRGPHLIAEVKFRSPSAGNLAEERMLEGILTAYSMGGARALSVLTEPNHFGGSLDHLRRASFLGLPTLMKDIVVDAQQVRAAAVCGASAVLLIQRVFDRGQTTADVDRMVREAHGEGLEVVLEVNNLGEYDGALETNADVIGINNRNLDSMEVDLGTTAALLRARPKDRPVVAMSGVERREDLLALEKAGADAVLVGTSLVASGDPRAKLKELLGGSS
jgi:indole-3-glycerol phosphate synthase